MTKEKVDLGAAFEMLKEKNRNYPTLLEGYVKAREILTDKKDEYRYARALGTLQGTIKSFLFIDARLDMSEIEFPTGATNETQSEINP